MNATPASLPSPPASASMAERVSHIEQCLHALDVALAAGAFDPIDQASTRLQRSLADTLSAFFNTPGERPVLDADSRRRLSLAQARVAHQQGAVQRAALSVERTLAVLLPREDTAAGTYGALAQSPAAKALQAYR